MSKNKRKPVYFSKIKKRDLALLEYAEQIDPLTGEEQNFSEFVKELIEERMLREQQGSNNNNSTRGLTIIDVQNGDDETYTLEVKDEDKEAMNSFL